MRLDFLRHEYNDRLILIFAGWGSDKESFRNVSMPGWDVAVVSEINAVVPDFSILEAYGTVYLYAWSLGVRSADRYLPETLAVTKAYAINGTLNPCDDAEGIPEAVFINTLKGLDARNLYKFRVRMCGGVAAYKALADRFEHINDVDSLRAQLAIVADAKAEERKRRLKWDRAYISTEDRIFPVSNQKRAWTGVAEIFELTDAPHYVDLQEIVTRTIVDAARVGKRFTRSLTTYDAHAHAQRLISETLAQKASRYFPAHPIEKAIEIGPGTGLFTSRWSEIFKADSVTFIDVCDMPHYGIARHERYFKEDAEAVMSRLAQSEAGDFSALFSTSAIQWFSNLPLFFDNCARVLRPDGFMAVSTFAPGNLMELQRLRPDHLQYTDTGAIKEMLGSRFEKTEVEESKIELEFTTAIEALRHLQLTGVTSLGGHSAGISKLRHFAETFPMNGRGRYVLTFRPVYILAGNPIQH